MFRLTNLFTYLRRFCVVYEIYEWHFLFADMESLPSIQSLQMALLNDLESEEELLSVLSHLLVCAIEDPGIPSAQRHTTMLGQTLNRADITHSNISEILRVYLNANATGEVVLNVYTYLCSCVYLFSAFLCCSLFSVSVSMLHGLTTVCTLHLTYFRYW